MSCYCGSRECPKCGCGESWEETAKRYMKENEKLKKQIERLKKKKREKPIDRTER